MAFYIVGQLALRELVADGKRVFADYTAAGIAVGAIGTFNHAYWTLAYLRLTTPVEEIMPQSDEGV